MRFLLLSLNFFRRDWRAGEWRVLLIALVLASGSIATVGLFADRVRLALQQEAASLLAADLRITSTRPLPRIYREAALQRGLRVTETASFPSMASAKGESVVAEMQAVGEGYPLRGEIVIDDGEPHVTRTIPSRGTLWADVRLMQRLGLQAGDEVGIGKLNLRLAAHVVRDVDQSMGFVSFAPRVILNAVDLPSTGLVQEGSRIHYRLLVAGGQQQVAALRGWLHERLGSSEKLEDVRDARPEIRVALERAEHFLGLAALTAVVLAGVALALAARYFISRHLDACAMMRCMGADQSQMLRIFLYQFLLLGTGAVSLGGLLGYAVQEILVQSIPAMREAALPAPGWLPLVQAAASGMALLLGFAFLPLWQLKRVPPMRVIHRELGAPQASAWLLYGAGAAVLGALFLWQAGSPQLGLSVLGGLAAGLLLFWLLAWLALHALAHSGHHACANLARHARSNSVQIVALSLGGMALLLLTFVRNELMESWRSRLPPDAPNRFIVNIQPDQRDAVRDFFAQQGMRHPEMFPMVRGRLVAINQRSVSGDDYPDPRARGLLERETNLSWMRDRPVHNELVQGQWLAAGDKAMSLEEGFAKTLNIHLGDTLAWDVAGEQFEARVTSLRKVRWDSMQVNFFVIVAPGMLEKLPASYITSFYMPDGMVQAANALIRLFPNLLLIDAGQMIAQVRSIMDQIAQAMSVVFLFTLLSGLAVLYAAMLATQDERIRESAVLRTLGADSSYLRRLHLTEFAMLGALSGLFAAGGAALLGWVLAWRVLDIPYQPGLLLWTIGIVGGMAVTAFSGWLATRHIARSSPLSILQSG